MLAYRARARRGRRRRRQQQLDGRNDRSRVAVRVVPSSRARAAWLEDPGDRVRPSRETPPRSRPRAIWCAARSSGSDRCRRRRGRRPGARRETGEVGAQLDQRQDPALRAPSRRRRPADAQAASARPRLVAECCQPSGPRKSTSLRAPSAGVRRSRASWSSCFQPGR